MCGRVADELLTGLREATFHHVLVADRDGAYAFRHALLQEAAYAELLPGERVALHGAYAAALAAHPEWAASPPGRPASWPITTPPRAISAGRWRPRWRRPARPSDSYALGEAHALYEQALALWDQVPAVRAVRAGGL